ncbi:hypothetical protein Ddye_001235 [Dipteronia dyeriana]|uniref:CS domain-containing protein n=1 Tax=Dipteronia dyeriana TaxID=168575 RepID=A0AAD9XNQ3_9ROSI|nr:hypothetical protein Ddye_001235 [Dipteronia dyeriana]
MATATASYLCFLSKTPEFSLPSHSLSNFYFKPIFSSCIPINNTFYKPANNVKLYKRLNRRLSCNNSCSSSQYEFSDGSSEIELRLQLGTGEDILSSKDVFVDAHGSSLTVRLKLFGSLLTLIETHQLFDQIKPSETIWYIDDDQLVISMKKQDPELKWPDIVESWESLTAGSMQLLKGTSIYLVGDSTEINDKVARELAVGLGYTPLSTKELLESFAKQTVDSWMLSEGSASVAEGEYAILESLSSHVRAVVATLGGQKGTSARADKWRHLYAGFTVWLSQTEAEDEDSAKEETRRHVQDGYLGYSNADVVVKLHGWDADHAKSVAQASLSALKQLILSDKKLPGKKSLYIRLGCRGDWPDIKPPGWDPSTGADASSATMEH